MAGKQIIYLADMNPILRILKMAERGRSQTSVWHHYNYFNITLKWYPIAFGL